MKNSSLILFFFVFSFWGFSQGSILCPKQATIIRIQNENNVPTVTDNLDGTVTLTGADQYITDIFGSHVIYDFRRTYPMIDSEPLNQYYSIFFKSKDLINELYNTVPTDVFFFDYGNYPSTPISTETINFLDGKTFKVTKSCTIADNSGEPCPEQDVPEDFILNVTFNYNSNNGLLMMESVGLTPCGNSFSIGLNGGTQANTFQLWESVPETVSEANQQPCYEIESLMFKILGIECIFGNNSNITPTMYVENNINTLILQRTNLVFGYDTLTLEETTFPVQEDNLASINLINNNGPFINFTNIDDNNYSIEIFSVLGIKILDKTPFENNKISTSTLANGLHFIKITNSNNQSKVFKLIN